jgi:tetratricopeptide (TPR) repeat protein
MTGALATLTFLLTLSSVALSQTPNPNSREIYQAAQRERAGSDRALELYRRYVQLEPDDAWGHLALAEAYAAARRFSEAFGSLARAERLAPGESDVAIVRARVQRAHRASLPTVKPSFSGGRDSDGNTSLLVGMNGDVAMSAASRLGLAGSHLTTRAEASSATVDRGAVTFAVRKPTMRWTSELGAARLTHDRSYTIPVGQTHLRWSRGAWSPAIDLRVRRAPVTAAYSLIRAEALLTEARGVVDVPVTSRLKLRANGQVGVLDDRVDPIIAPASNRGRRPRNTVLPYTETNRRTGYGGAVVTALSATSELAANAYRLTYEHLGSGNYFAPEFVDLLELGTYSEIYRFDPLTIAFDAGVGMQRVKQFGGVVGDVTPAGRLWGQVTWPVTSHVEVSAEVDAYRSQMSTVATSSTWGSVMGGLAVRWLVR